MEHPIFLSSTTTHIILPLPFFVCGGLGYLLDYSVLANTAKTLMRLGGYYAMFARITLKCRTYSKLFFP